MSAAQTSWCPQPAIARHRSSTAALLTNFYGAAIVSGDELRSFSIPNSVAAAGETPCTMERRRVPLPDGGYVDISLCLPEGQLRGLMLVVYGNYGLKPLFPLQRLYHPLLRRGIGLGVAHVRGGGEYGPQGWKSARGNNKEVSATDLIALSRSLHPTPIVIRAQSAGGLVALRALSATPELFRGAVLIAPVLDHGRSLSDPRIAGQQENDRFE